MHKYCRWESNGKLNCKNVKNNMLKNGKQLKKKSKIIPSIIPFARRIIAIGDLHGDLEKIILIFKKAKLIKKFGKSWRWIGKDTHVVQIGDQIDYGGRAVGNKDYSKELEVINFLDIMHLKAIKHKGAVISLLGNHELMNVTGNFQYVSNKGVKDFINHNVRQKSFAPGGIIAKHFANTRNVIVKIGKWVFVHAGILPYWAKNYKITDLNNLIKDYLLGKKSINNKLIQRIVLNTHNDSFLWTREYGYPSHNNYCNKLNLALKYLNANAMVVGHSIQNNIKSACNNKLWLIDVGISKCFKGVGANRIQVLEIIHNQNGSVKTIKVIK